MILVCKCLIGYFLFFYWALWQFNALLETIPNILYYKLILHKNLTLSIIYNFLISSLVSPVISIIKAMSIFFSNIFLAELRVKAISDELAAIAQARAAGRHEGIS